MKIHIVQKGDTLWEIAKKYGVDFEQLKAINSHLASPDMIMPGMKIKIPGVEKTVPKEMVQKKTEEIKHPYEDFVVSEQPVKKEKAKVKMETPKEMIKKQEKMPMMEPIMPAMPELPEMPMMQMPTMQQMPMMEQTQYTTIQLPEMKMKKKEKPEKEKQKVYEKKPIEYQTYHMPQFIPCIPICHMPLHPCWHPEHPMPMCHKCMHHDGCHHMKLQMHPPVHPGMSMSHAAYHGMPVYHGMDPHMYHHHDSNEQPVYPIFREINKQSEGQP